MRIAHTADWHLGFRMFDRQNKRGANQREIDVADAVHRVVTGIIAAQPDAVLLAGDLFHSVRPTNYAICMMFAELQRLRTGVPRARIVAIAGDHDSPRTSETGYILSLYKALDLDLALSEPAVFPIGDGWAVTAVPKWAVPKLPALRPQEGARNVLLVHGEARKVPGQQIDPEGMSRSGWDLVCLGHWHVCQQVGARAWYSGSLEYVSTSVWTESRTHGPWDEVAAGSKGWLLVELADGADPLVCFQPVETRRHVDLEPIDAHGLSAAAVDAAIAERAVDVDGAVVRLVIANIARATQHALKHEAIRQLKARALHFHLDYRRPEAEKPQPRLTAALVDCAAGCGRSVPEDELLCARCAGTADPWAETEDPEDLDVVALGAELRAAAVSGTLLPDPYQ